MIRILIADDHAVVRKGMIQILEESALQAQCDEAGDGHETINMIRQGNYDVLLLDIAMPGKNGVDVLKQIRQEGAKLPVLILSMYPPEQYAVRLIRAGASGYLTKESAPEQLAEAVEAVSQGRKYISSTVADLLADSLSGNQGVEVDDNSRHQQLSDREYQVFLRLAAGQGLTEIGKEFHLSVKTIASYRSRILQKMGIKTNAEMTLYASRNELI